ncbi:zinc-dependent metalloprotease, partial [Candidatus Amoebophilus asiaticus]|nr:zinc-dependent metalloprotease [Candidatus Amoebophilus asiaticus]
IYKQEMMKDSGHLTCGTVTIEETQTGSGAGSNNNSNAARLASNGECFVVELAIDSDYEFQQKYPDWTNKIIDIVNTAALAYDRDLGAILKINVMHTWGTKPINYPYDSYDFFDLMTKGYNFALSTWGKSSLDGTSSLQPAYDLFHMLTGRDCHYLGNYTVGGIAYQPGFVSTSEASWYIAFTHEIGHNLNANHNDGVPGSIMAAGNDNYFSTNNMTNMTNYLNSKLGYFNNMTISGRYSNLQTCRVKKILNVNAYFDGTNTLQSNIGINFKPGFNVPSGTVLSASIDPDITSCTRITQFGAGIQILNYQSDTTVCQSSSIKFYVNALDYYGSSLSYQWQVNTDSGFANIDSAWGRNYTISGTTSSMSGHMYRCSISTSTSTYINFTPSATLFVLTTTPIITTNPQDTVFCDGDNASFSVVATGSGLTYQWQVFIHDDFYSMFDGDSTFYSGTKTSTFNYVSVPEYSDGWVFRCMVSNGVCTATSASATLTVRSSSHPDCESSSKTTLRELVNEIPREQFEVYPIPNEGMFNIKMGRPGEIEIYDSIGNLVMKKVENEHQLLPIDLTDKPAGIYLIKYSTGNEVYTKKVMVK